MKYLDMFIEDCKYYDIENIELKSILKSVNVKEKTILDLGTGIGRLAFPLLKHAKKVVALDNDKRLEKYFRKNKKKNLTFVNQNAKKYIKGKKFDIILLAWPIFNFNFIEHVKNAMHKKSRFIFLTCDNNSDFETIVDKLGVVKKERFKKDVLNKNKFLEQLSKRFRVLIKKKLKTRYIYPNKKTAFRVIKNGIRMWFKINLNKKAEEKLIKLINKHKKKGKIIFDEEIYLYILKLK